MFLRACQSFRTVFPRRPHRRTNCARSVRCCWPVVLRFVRFPPDPSLRHNHLGRQGYRAGSFPIICVLRNSFCILVSKSSNADPTSVARRWRRLAFLVVPFPSLDWVGILFVCRFADTTGVCESSNGTAAVVDPYSCPLSPSARSIVCFRVSTGFRCHF